MAQAPPEGGLLRPPPKLRKKSPKLIPGNSVSPNTWSYDFTETCVFGKQSPGLGHYDLLREEAPLLSKLWGYFAKFLRESCLAPLGPNSPSVDEPCRGTLRLALATAPVGSLNQATAYKAPAHSSTGTRSEIQFSSHLLRSLRFHVLFHSPMGVLFTFPSWYYFTIGHPGVFSLTRWSLLIHTRFHVPHATRCAYDVAPGGSLASVYHLTKIQDNADQPEEVCIKGFVPRKDPRIPSVFRIWKSADFQERESYDMLGILHESHPRLKRILMPESWIGWPLRKDYIAPHFYEIQDAH
eukprot:Gb_17982 [translate_table: standard]